MSQVEVHYDQFQSSLREMINNVDVNLMMKIMYLERKLPDAPPRVELEIELKPRVNQKLKEHYFKEKYGFPTSTIGDDSIFVVGKMDMDMVEEIARDPDVAEISGKANPASY